MTTLRNFQNEIEDIHNREMSKQRAAAVLDKEKDQRSVKGKAKEDHAVTETKSPLPGTVRLIGPGRSEEVEERILVRQDLSYYLLPFHKR
jgi:hypothetical protein